MPGEMATGLRLPYFYADFGMTAITPGALSWMTFQAYCIDFVKFI